MYAFAFFYHSIMLNDGHGILLFGYDHYAYSNEIREGNLSLILRKKIGSIHKAQTFSSDSQSSFEK